MENENNNNYGQQNDAYGQNPYEQNQYNPYGEQQNNAYGQNPYEQNQYNPYGEQQNNAYGQNQYGQPYYNMNGAPTDENGNPVKNRFGMKLTFSILEIISCNLISLVCGIIGCIFTAKANTSYKEGRWEEFKSQAKTATISLWIGFVGVILSIIIGVSIIVFTIATGYAIMDEMEANPDFSIEDSILDDYGDYDYSYDDPEYDDSYADDSYADDYSDATEEEAPAEPVDVIPGDGFIDPSITLNGAYIELPLTYAELEALGFSLDEEDKEYVLNKNEYDTPMLYNSEGEYIGYVYLGNLTEEPLAMKDCLAFGLQLLDMDVVEFSLSNGINEYATSEDVKKAYGTPDYEYEDDESDYQSYQWYNHNDIYEDADENSIEITFWEGELEELDLRYIGWE